MKNVYEFRYCLIGFRPHLVVEINQIWTGHLPVVKAGRSAGPWCYESCVIENADRCCFGSGFNNGLLFSPTP